MSHPAESEGIGSRVKKLIGPWLSRRNFLAAAGSAVAPLPFLRVRQLGASEALYGTREPNFKGPKPFVVAEQGSFAAGGTVISNPGTYDPLNPTPAGKPSTAITPTSNIRFRRTRAACRS